MTRLPLLASLLALGCGVETGRKPTADSRPSGDTKPAGYRADPDMQLLSGEWRVTAITATGKPVPADTVSGLKLTYRFAGTSLMVNRPNQPVQPWSYALDSRVTPKRIVLNQPDETKLNGIYELNGSTLRICTNLEGGLPPAKFESTAHPKTDLLTLEKAN